MSRQHRHIPSTVARRAAPLVLGAVLAVGTIAPAVASTTPPPSPAAPSHTASPSRTATATPTPSPSPSASKDLYDPGAVMVTPPAPTGTASFAYTTSRSISPAKYQSLYGGCPAGWYARPAQPDVAVPTSPNASVSAATGPDVTASSASTSANIPSTGNGHLFQNVSVQYYNWSLLHSHPASLTFWCDAVPSWYADAPELSAGMSSVGISPVDPSCYYCNFTAQYTNLATGLALDPGGSTGSPVLVQTPTNTSGQNWYLQGDSGGSVFAYDIATFGLWQPSTLLSTAIADGNGAYVFAGASDDPPDHGQFSYVDWGAGQVYNAVMFIETDTTWSGSTPLGGSCLTASGGAGSQAVPTPCDASNDAQWWIEHEGD